jgi:hypothetical protein
MQMQTHVGRCFGIEPGITAELWVGYLARWAQQRQQLCAQGFRHQQQAGNGEKTGEKDKLRVHAATINAALRGRQVSLRPAAPRPERRRSQSHAAMT